METLVLFGLASQKILKEFTLLPGIRLLQYVDVLLLSGEQEKVEEKATVKIIF